LGSDFVITNSENQSYISYADYAVAMVDEIENRFHVKTRFTAISEKKRPEEKKDAYYGPYKEAPKFEGMSRYRPPFNYELSGKKFKLVMDTEKNYYINFLDGQTLEWSVFGETAKTVYYECAKAEELTYLVNFEFTDVIPRTNITLIIDLEQRLVTFVRSIVGFNQKYPTLIECVFDFGAIDIAGFPLPKKRHEYTTDLIGKRIHWHYSPEFSIVHVYCNPTHIRVTFIEGTGPSVEAMAEMNNAPYDEKACYIKIKDGIYFVSAVEQDMARRGLPGNSLLFLMDIKRVHDVGRSFGHSGQFGGTGYLPENYLFGAYGEFVYSDGVLEAAVFEKK
jgi:hypothetical protein